MRITTAATITAALLATTALGACNPVRGHSRHESSTTVSTSDDDGHDKALTVAAILDCPEHQGDLTRTAQAADGKTCDYTGNKGEVVGLSLMALDGVAPGEALKPTETLLKGLVPDTVGQGVNISAASDGKDPDHAKIDLPGFHIDAHGDKAHMKILGQTIDADNDHAEVHARAGGMREAVVRAGPGGAEVRANRVGEHSAKLYYMMASTKPGPEGWRTAGYIAKGPVAGPLVVATFKSKEEHHGEIRGRDLDHLVDRNAKSE